MSPAWYVGRGIVLDEVVYRMIPEFVALTDGVSVAASTDVIDVIMYHIAIDITIVINKIKPICVRDSFVFGSLNFDPTSRCTRTFLDT